MHCPSIVTTGSGPSGSDRSKYVSHPGGPGLMTIFLTGNLPELDGALEAHSGIARAQAITLVAESDLAQR